MLERRLPKVTAIVHEAKPPVDVRDDEVADLVASAADIDRKVERPEVGHGDQIVSGLEIVP